MNKVLLLVIFLLSTPGSSAPANGKYRQTGAGNTLTVRRSRFDNFAPPSNISQFCRNTETTDQSILLFTVSAVLGFVALDVIEKEFLMKFITNSTWKKSHNE